MDLSSLAITLPLAISLTGVVVAICTLRLNRRKYDDQSSKESIERQKIYDEERKQTELQILSIQKDVQYIRVSIDGVVDTTKDHERRIVALEKKALRSKKEVK